MTAQFGVAGNRKVAGTNFQDLQELAKQKAARESGPDGSIDNVGGGADMDMAKMQDMFKNVMDNPDYMKAMGDFGSQFGDAIEQMMKLSPDELAVQMEQAMKLMTDGDMVENIVNQKDAVLKSLEESGVVPPEELARYKTDPAYFELKMRESFEQMGELFDNPEYIAKAAEAMQDMTKLMNDPDSMNDMMKAMIGDGKGIQDDENLEEARLKFLAGDFGEIPGFKDAFETPEMQEILKDPVKWKETVKEGLDGLMGGGVLGAAKDEL